MRYLIICIALLAGCGGGGGVAEPAKTTTSNIPSIMIIGDSMAAGNYYNTATKTVGKTNWYPAAVNRGTSGAPLEYIVNDSVDLVAGTMIVYAGFNNIKHLDQAVAGIVNKYAALLKTFVAGRTICIGIPFMEHTKSDPWFPAGAAIDNARIQAVNNGIKSVCPEYIDTSDVATVDGVHPEYAPIIARLKLENK